MYVLLTATQPYTYLLTLAERSHDDQGLLPPKDRHILYNIQSMYYDDIRRSSVHKIIMHVLYTSLRTYNVRTTYSHPIL
jgi:hypothetical protein